MDFQNALNIIVPTAQRSESSGAQAIPAYVQTLFIPPLKAVLSLLCFVFSPSWKAVEKAYYRNDILLKIEESRFGNIDRRLEELREKSMDGTNEVVNMPANSRSNLQLHKRSSRNNSRNNSVTDNNFSEDLYEVALKNESRGVHVNSLPDRASVFKSYPKKGIQAGTMLRPSLQSFTHLHQRQRALSDLSKVFFDLHEITYGEEVVCGSKKHNRIGSIFESSQEKGASSTSERGSISSTSSSMDLSHFLGTSSNPHVLPAVHHPRLVLCGQADMGQSSYLGPAVIHALEDLPVRIISLETVFNSSSRCPEEAFIQVSVPLTTITCT